MTLEVSSSKQQSSLESIDLKFLQELLQSHPQYNQQKWERAQGRILIINYLLKAKTQHAEYTH